jgi:hypothetical protein
MEVDAFFCKFSPPGIAERPIWGEESKMDEGGEGCFMRADCRARRNAQSQMQRTSMFFKTPGLLGLRKLR